MFKNLCSGVLVFQLAVASTFSTPLLADEASISEANKAKGSALIQSLADRGWGVESRDASDDSSEILVSPARATDGDKIVYGVKVGKGVQGADKLVISVYRRAETLQLLSDAGFPLSEDASEQETAYRLRLTLKDLVDRVQVAQSKLKSPDGRRLASAVRMEDEIQAGVGIALVGMGYFGMMASLLVKRPSWMATSFFVSGTAFLIGVGMAQRAFNRMEGKSR